jgi:hypothetical protein
MVYRKPHSIINFFVNMKKLYPLASLLLSCLILTSASQAQTYSFTYTAVNDGNWADAATWDPSGKPSATCSNCHIVINSAVTLNTSVTLTNSSLLTVSGSGASIIIGSSNGADWAHSYNILVANDNSNPANSIVVTNGGKIDASSADQSFDGVFLVDLTSSPNAYARKVGAGPSTYSGTNVFDATPYSHPVMSSGSSLSGTGILPILLVNFEAVVNSGAVDLTWTTAMESNSARFDVERSSDGARWDVIGTLAAKGNSSTPSYYSFTDANPGSGTVEYRIHEYDLDGRPTFSTVKVVRTTPIASVSVFPNPAKDYLNISIPATETSAVHIRLIGQSGQVLAEKNVNNAGGSVQTFSVSNYPTGNYLVQVVTSDGTKQVTKVLISRN